MRRNQQYRPLLPTQAAAMRHWRKPYVHVTRRAKKLSSPNALGTDTLVGGLVSPALGLPPGSTQPQPQRGGSILGSVLSISIGFLGGGIIGLIAGRKGKRWTGALWGAGAGALTAVPSHYARSNFGAVGLVASLLGTWGAPIVAARHGTK